MEVADMVEEELMGEEAAMEEATMTGIIFSSACNQVCMRVAITAFLLRNHVATCKMEMIGDRLENKAPISSKLDDLS